MRVISHPEQVLRDEPVVTTGEAPAKWERGVPQVRGCHWRASWLPSLRLGRSAI